MNDLRNILDSLSHVQAEADRVPELLRQLAEAQTKASTLEASLTKTEGDLIDEMTKNDQLTANVKALEVARDNAGFRADAAERKLEAIGSVIGPVVVPAQPVTEGKVVPFDDSPEGANTPPTIPPVPASSPVAGPEAGATGEPVVYQGYVAPTPQTAPLEAGAGLTSTPVVEPASPSTDYSPGDATLTSIHEEPVPYSPPVSDPYTRDGRQSSYIDDQGNRRRWNYTLSRWDTEAKEAGLGQTQLPSSSW